MGENEFAKFAEEKLFSILVKKGCVRTIKNLFSLFGISEDIGTVFN